MKATIIVSIALCVVIGGILGWALRAATAHPSGSVSMVDITPDKGNTSIANFAVYDGDSGILKVFTYDSSRGEIGEADSKKIK